VGRITDNVRGTWAIRGSGMAVWEMRWELCGWICCGAAVAEPISVSVLVNGACWNVLYPNVLCVGGECCESIRVFGVLPAEGLRTRKNHEENSESV